MMALVWVRLHFSPPILFLEGDDVALCAGIARLSNNEDIGPYYYHPPPIPVIGAESSTQQLLGQRDPAARFYRYDTMTGMYFLGYLTRRLGAVAERMSWICFLAGTVSPLLLAVFLVRFFRPSSSFALPLCYLAIAVSPEQWTSGSAYINDKIVASCCLAAALCVTVISQRARANLWWATVSGALLGLAALMRFDSIFLIPAAVLITAASEGPARHRLWATALLLASAAATYAAICMYMDAPFPYYFLFGSGIAKPTSLSTDIPIVLSAFGPAQLLVFSVSALGWLAWLTVRLVQTAVQRTYPPPSLRHPIVQTTLIALLVLPETAILYELPFKSQKYVLVSASVVAGLSLLLPLLFWERVCGRAARAPKRAACLAVTLVLPVALLVAGAWIPFGVERSGQDGARSIGGHLQLRLREHPGSVDARSLFALLDRSQNVFVGQVVVPRPSWMLEEAIAYQAALRAWTNGIVRTSAVPPAGSQFLSLNHYTHPIAHGIGVLVPCDAESFRYQRQLSADVLQRAAGASGLPVYFLDRERGLKLVPAK